MLLLSRPINPRMVSHPQLNPPLATPSALISCKSQIQHTLLTILILHFHSGADVGYFAIVQIGTPPQDFKILMDSGSADLWVGSEDCQSNGGGCGNHTFLGSSSSSSFVDLGKHFQITYGTGAVAGNKVTDNLSIAGLSLPGHQFGVALNETVDFSGATTPFDGLMGLGQSVCNS